MPRRSRTISTNAGDRNTQIERQPVHAEAEREKKILAENFSGVDGRRPLLFFAH
jgi:hypothetical protein